MNVLGGTLLNPLSLLSAPPPNSPPSHMQNAFTLSQHIEMEAWTVENGMIIKILTECHLDNKIRRQQS